MKDTIGQDIDPISADGHGDGAKPLSDTELLAGTEPTGIAVRSRKPWRIALPVILILVLGLLAVWWLTRPANAELTSTVTRGTIISSVETTGKLEPQTEASLSFQTGGQVVKVLAKQGDNVEEGQVLAELDTSDLQSNLDQANAQLDISKLKLQQAKDGATPQDIAGATANLNAAVARLNNTRSGGRVEDIAAATAQLNQAQAKLDAVRKGPTQSDIDRAQATLDQAKANLQSVQQPASPDDISQAEAAVRQAQAQYDSLKAGPTHADLEGAQAAVNEATATLNKLKAGPTQQDIADAQAQVDQAKAQRAQTAATASNAKEQARLAMGTASDALQNAQDVYGKIKWDNDHTNPKDLTDDRKNQEAKAWRDVQDAQAGVDEAVSNYNTAKANEIAELASADAVVSQAQAALDKLTAGPSAQDVAADQATVDQAQAKLDALKAGPKPDDLAAAQAAVDQAQAKLDGLKAGGTPAAVAAAQANVDNAQAALDGVKVGPTADDIRQAQEGVNEARANLDKVKNGATPNDINEAQAEVDAAQADLDKLKAGPQQTDLEILQKQIDLAQISVDQAQSRVSDAQLKAPIGGTLLTFDLAVGDVVSQQNVVAKVADTGSLKVNADVDELDVGRVNAGQVVTVTLDAYPGVKMAGRIDEIAPGATQKQGSTVYQAKVSFTPVSGVVPREGMAANVDITAERKDNVLLLPNRAFETVGNRQYVTLKQNGTTTSVEVETGLSNNTETEVLSGLHEGQVVVLK
jgi:HlyD family secretion protein